MRAGGAILLCALSAALGGGCAIASKGEPLRPRYFSPDTWPQADHGSERAAGAPLRLRLGEIRASAHLRERLAYRRSPNELAYHEALRWTERPEDYLRRALSQNLFELRGIERVSHGRAPLLELELVAFEEVLSPEHVARVRVVYVLDGADGRSSQRTIEVERAIESRRRNALPVVRALGSALRDAVDQIAAAVVARIQPGATAPEADSATALNTPTRAGGPRCPTTPR